MRWSLVPPPAGSSRAKCLQPPLSLAACCSSGWKLLLHFPYVSSRDPWNTWRTTPYTSDTPTGYSCFACCPFEQKTTDILRWPHISRSTVCIGIYKGLSPPKANAPFAEGTALSLFTQGTDHWSGHHVMSIHPFTVFLIQREGNTASNLCL